MFVDTEGPKGVIKSRKLTYNAMTKKKKVQKDKWRSTKHKTENKNWETRTPLKPSNSLLWQSEICDKVCKWLAAGQWFSLGISVSSINKTDRHNITEILLKVVLNTITITLNRIANWGLRWPMTKEDEP